MSNALLKAIGTEGTEQAVTAEGKWNKNPGVKANCALTQLFRFELVFAVAFQNYFISNFWEQLPLHHLSADSIPLDVYSSLRFCTLHGSLYLLNPYKVCSLISAV